MAISAPKMLKYFKCILILSGSLVVCSWAYTITSFVKDGLPIGTDVTTAPFLKIGYGYYFFENATKRNWYDAFEQCRQMNAALISFETMEEWSFIDRYRKSLRDGNRYWTSGTDLAQEGSHVWFATGKPININVWTADNPNNDANAEHCDELGWKSHRFGTEGMNDLPCLSELYYICEAPQPQTASFVVW